MSNLIPGNQKHLTLDDRVFIEKSLDNSMSLINPSTLIVLILSSVTALPI